MEQKVLNKKEVSDLLTKAGLKVSVSLLNKYITNGKGPKFIKHGKRVYYHTKDVSEWYHSIIDTKFKCSAQVSK